MYALQSIIIEEKRDSMYLLCLSFSLFISQFLRNSLVGKVKMNHPDQEMFYFLFQIVFLLACLVTANSLYFVFRRYKVMRGQTHLKIELMNHF